MTYACTTGLCGAYDCATCHPELQEHDEPDVCVDEDTIDYMGEVG